MAGNFSLSCQWKNWLAACAVTAAMTGSSQLLAGTEEESAEQRRARLEAMSAEQKESIRQKRERFESLSKEEQDRLRKLYGEIEVHPQCERLKKVMANYHEWLKMLPAKYQTEVLSVPLEKRIGKIKEIQARVAAERLTVIASDLSSEDVNQISMWLEVYVSSHEKEFTKSTPPQFKAALERLPKHERVRRHIWGINWRLDNPDLLPAPTDDELANFVSVLSPAAHKVLDEAASPEQKWQDAQEFIRQVQISKRMPQVSDEELQKFAATLTPDQREELESKNPEDMKRELRRMYGWHKNGYGPGANPWEVGGTGSRPFKGGRTNKGGEGKFGPPPRGGRPEPSKPDEAKPGEGRARTRSQPTSEEKP